MLRHDEAMGIKQRLRCLLVCGTARPGHDHHHGHNHRRRHGDWPMLGTTHDA